MTLGAKYALSAIILLVIQVAVVFINVRMLLLENPAAPALNYIAIIINAVFIPWNIRTLWILRGA